MNEKRTQGDLVPVRWNAKGQVTGYEYREPELAQPPQVIDVSPIMTPTLGQLRQSTSHIEGSWSDRARAFNLTTANLSLVTGVLFVVASVFLNGAILPIFTLAMIFFSGFSVTWLGAFLIHTLISAEGAQFVEVWRLWNFLDREQRERHIRYRPAAAGDHRLATWLRFVIVVLISTAGVYITALIIELLGGAL